MRFSFAVLSLLAVVLCWWSVCVVEGQQAPIQTYKRGHRNRVEYIKAEIKKQHLDKGTGTNQKTRAYAQSMGGRNDDAGHLIAQRLGGTGRDTYNIIPQNKNINRGAWRNQVEAKIYNEVKAGRTIIFEVWPRYKTPTDTRPNAIVYQAKKSNGQTFLKKNSIPNPPSSPPKGRGRGKGDINTAKI
ncbi:hypothetical protein GE061_014231 [Apolygus lucorum]|uniref:Type VII secretion system protein EssD-like domain-containing protein n=1 Tax=Apolygus lucorum TaxID=248454 RepID=A0A6A4JNP3_APOLU|nr:hypothetical protein GE061_014231 [Apolygus lucorum]